MIARARKWLSKSRYPSVHQAQGCRDNTTGRNDGNHEYEVAVVSMMSVLLRQLLVLLYSTSEYYCSLLLRVVLRS